MELNRSDRQGGSTKLSGAGAQNSASDEVISIGQRGRFQTQLMLMAGRCVFDLKAQRNQQNGAELIANFDR